MTNFKMDSFEPFMLILAGQSELKRIMEFAVLEPLNQRVAIRYHMPGLSPEQTHHYITHQLKLAGAHEPILDDKAMDAVYEVSFGIPRRIRRRDRTGPHLCHVLRKTHGRCRYGTES